MISCFVKAITIYAIFSIPFVCSTTKEEIEAQHVKLTIEPQTIIAGETESVKITCRMLDLDRALKTLHFLQLLRDVTTRIIPKSMQFNNSKLMAMVGPEKRRFAYLVDETLITRAAVQGWQTTDRPQVQIVLSKITCKDTGIYICKLSLTLFAGKRNVNSTDVINVTIHSHPNNIKMTVEPSKTSPYDVGEMVVLRCTGHVGIPPKSWSWQWTYADGEKPWTPYGHPGNIWNDSPNMDVCNNTANSTLTHKVTAKDYKRMFRCLLDNNEAYSDHYVLITTSNSTLKPSKQSSNSTLKPSKQSTSSNSIAIMASVIAFGILAFILVIAIIIGICLNRKEDKLLSQKKINSKTTTTVINI